MSWTGPSSTSSGPGQAIGSCPRSRTCGRDGGKPSAWLPTAACCASDRTRADASPIPIRAAGLPGFRPAPEDEAIGTVITRYLYAYGPATPQQFAPVDRCPAELGRRAIRPAQPNSPRSTSRARRPLGDYAGHRHACGTDAKGGVRLLPYFDAYVVGSHPRDRLFPGKAARALSPRPARQATIRSCSSMAWWLASGTSVAPAARLRSPSSRSSGLPLVSTGLWQLKSSELARSSRAMPGSPSGRSPSEGTLELRERLAP